MTAAELARYNLARLVRESGRDPKDIVVAAWPLSPDIRTAARRRIEVENRRRKLARYMGEYLRDGKHIEIPLAELDALAPALGVRLQEFFADPQP